MSAAVVEPVGQKANWSIIRADNWMSDFGYACSLPLTGYNSRVEREVEKLCQRKRKKRSSNL